jgi:hypothetical protein
MPNARIIHEGSEEEGTTWQVRSSEFLGGWASRGSKPSAAVSKSSKPTPRQAQAHRNGRLVLSGLAKLAVQVQPEP